MNKKQIGDFDNMTKGKKIKSKVHGIWRKRIHKKHFRLSVRRSGKRYSKNENKLDVDRVL